MTVKQYRDYIIYPCSKMIKESINPKAYKNKKGTLDFHYKTIWPIEYLDVGESFAVYVTPAEMVEQKAMDAKCLRKIRKVTAKSLKRFLVVRHSELNLYEIGRIF